MYQLRVTHKTSTDEVSATLEFGDYGKRSKDIFDNMESYVSRLCAGMGIEREAVLVETPCEEEEEVSDLDGAINEARLILSSAQIDEETLMEHLYVVNGHSVSEIATYFDKCNETVRRKLMARNVKMRDKFDAMRNRQGAVSEHEVNCIKETLTKKAA